MRLVSIAILLVAATAGRAANGQASSGPKPGAEIKAFRATAATGDNAEKSVDFVADRNAKPTVYIFVQAADFDRPLARLLKVLDEEMSKGIDGAAGAEVVAVWLTEDREKSQRYLPLAQQSLKLTRTTLSVFEGDANGPTEWDIDGAMHATAVVVKDRKVVESIGLVSPTATDLPKILAALKKT